VGAELPWGIGVCAFTLAPDHPEVLLVPDMKADARFNSMCAVVCSPLALIEHTLCASGA